jgi:hypothetical protein
LCNQEISQKKKEKWATKMYGNWRLAKAPLAKSIPVEL